MKQHLRNRLIHRSGYAWLAWGLGAALFFAEYFARVSPGVMVPDLMRDFHASAFQLGSLSAFFYYPYVFMQLPVGMLVDRYGPHRLLTLTAGCFSASCLLFASTHTLFLAELARFCMGLSAAFAFVGALKLAKIWFPSKRFGLLAGVTQALGMLGAAVGDAPVQLMVKHSGWRETMVLIGGVFLVLTFLIGFLVFESETQLQKKSEMQGHLRSMLAGLRVVLRNRQTWVNGLFVGFLYAPTAAFGELWGVNYLHVTYHLSDTASAFAISLIFIGWGFGGPLAGWLSDKMPRRRVMIGSAVCGILFLGTLLYARELSASVVFALLFMYGMTNSGVAVSYAYAGEINGERFAGTSMAFANMASVFIGAILQPVIGAIIDWHAGTKIVDMHSIAASDFRVAVSVLPVCLVLAVVSGLFLRKD
ncbi:MAG: MFS transporter [marine bacterium B5-7]|nr:MAG: MFS transporter [marine bacterium B5-7]